jgi:ribonuclease PH
MPNQRLDGRTAGQIRPLDFQRHWLSHVPGSVLVSAGGTRVLCTAIIEDGVPPFLVNSDQGWLTAEYSMLPGATAERRQRDRAGRTDGRSVEIQRLVGRALRATVNRKAFPGRTVWVDCDVLAADGGTRTTAINGAYVALHDAFTALKAGGGALRGWPLVDSVRAISIGLVEGAPVVDLSYYEDSQADVDLNLVMTGSGRVIEVSGGAERGSFALTQLHELIGLGQEALAHVGAAQEAALAR